MKLRAIFFDLDKTLWTFSDPDGRQKIYALQGQKLVEILEKHGVSVRWDPVFMGSVVGNGIWSAERAEYYSTAIPPRYGEILRKIVEFWNGEAPNVDWNEVYRALYVEEAPLKTVYPDVLPALARLKETGIKLGVISNRTMGGEPFLKEWRNTELAEYFDDIVVSCDVGYMKPHPEIFRIAMRRLEAKPEESMMVGDLLRADVIGAKWAGLTAVWINREGQENNYPSVKPDFEIKDFGELLRIVMEDESL